MILPALLCAIGLPAGLLLIRRVPACPPGVPCVGTSVSIIIPARNEERNLPRLLASISQLAIYPVEILVVDDGSADNSAAVAASFGARVLTSVERPEKWTGKSWACYQGACSASGELLLFLDADTFFLPGGLDALISCWARERDRNLVVSLLPYHEMRSPYEQLSLFFNILVAAGAGGFGALARPRLFGQSLLISKQAYFAAGGHGAVCGVVLENLRWAGKLRDGGARIFCAGGRNALHMRMFPDGFGQMSQSWAKAFLQGAGDSGRAVLAVSIAWISALWSTALLLVMPRGYGRASLALVYAVFALQIAWMARRIGAYRFLTCALFPLPLAYFCIVFGCGAAQRALGRKAMWRGRKV